MSRKKKDGRRATGVQSKKGMLYIVMTHNVVRDGRIVNDLSGMNEMIRPKKYPVS